MKKCEYVTVQLNNKKAMNAESANTEKSSTNTPPKVTHTRGYVPCVIGSSGKILSMDLIFEAAAE